MQRILSLSDVTPEILATAQKTRDKQLLTSIFAHASDFFTSGNVYDTQNTTYMLDEKDHTILWYAIACMVDEATVTKILKAGANAEEVYNDKPGGISAFFMAVELENTQALSALLKHNPELGTTLNPAGASPQHYAVLHAKLHVLEFFRKENPKYLRLLAKTTENTLLHTVADNGVDNTSIPVVNQAAIWLINADPSLVNTQNADGYTPLHLAVIKRNKKLITTLLHSQANISLTTKPTAKHPNVTPIQLAIGSDDKDIFQLFMAHSVDGYTPLHDAILRNDAIAVKMYLDHGADQYDLSTKNARLPGRNAFQLAQMLKTPDIAKLILNHYKLGCTIVHIAVITGNTKDLMTHLEYGPDLHLPTLNNTVYPNKTALQIAVEKNDCPAIFLLFENCWRRCDSIQNITNKEQLNKILIANFAKLTGLLGLDHHPVTEAEYSTLNYRAKSLFQYLDYYRKRLTEPATHALLLGDIFAYNQTDKIQAIWLAIPSICNYNHPNPLQDLEDTVIATLDNGRTKSISEPLIKEHAAQTQVPSPRLTGTGAQ